MRRIVHVCHDHRQATFEASRMAQTLPDSKLQYADITVSTDDEIHHYVPRGAPPEKFIGMTIDDIVWHVHISDTPRPLYTALVSRCGRS